MAVVSESRRADERGLDRGDAFSPEGPVEVAVVIVSYNSADDIRQLLPDLRREARAMPLRVIVADNSSTDGTVAMMSEHTDVVTVRTGGNLGYSGAINAAMRHVGEAEAILILNPDLRLDAGSIPRMLRRLRSDPRIGAVVPLLRDQDGSVYFSLRREPTVLRAAADAVIGRYWQRRPAPLSEYVRDPREYAWSHPVDWATGAALLLSAPAAAVVGEWDERFFLYSEESDIQRRLRDAGWLVWFDPAAGATHRRGGSGASPDLDALLAVNRVRYMKKHRPLVAGVFRVAVIAGEQLRRSPANARSRWALWSSRRWAALPHARRDPLQVDAFPRASIVIPAHQEAAVIDRTLAPLAHLAAAGRLEVVVVCNGCTDDTADRARAYAGVRVLETEEASKTAALNLGDAHASVWPRFYLDADIVVPPAALAPVITALSGGTALAGRPSFRLDLRGASPIVRAYYRARERMSSTSAALWGAGVYGVTRAGHARIGHFPSFTADDLYVDGLFAPEEKTFPVTEPVTVSVPRRTSALRRVLIRMRRGPAEQGVDTGASTARELARSVRGPLSATDAAIYAAFAMDARRGARGAGRRGADGWERDDSSRGSAAPDSLVGAG
ncbi:glycosyltransferase [Microbacterium lushaniae]|uniref:Glycosyltransferase n=1 Tax=Microbacterium lushaniae TaxID=2614639 RepID=A0A5J6L138_9MICO|nr:glycosyltransferase [Microbacterium lushaniae]